MSGAPLQPTFIVRKALEKAAWDNGFRIVGETVGSWLGFGSTTAFGRVWLAGSGDRGPWWLASDHPGIVAEFGEGVRADGPGLARYGFADQRELYVALNRAYRLGLSLPDAPLTEFERETRGLPQTTETERLTIQRIGQGIFRRALVEYWDGRCAVTGINDPALLRASHILPWAACTSDAQRLEVHNGLLLSALWDAAFDAGLVTFDDAGAALTAPNLSIEAREALGLPSFLRHRPASEQRRYLHVHRSTVATWSAG